MCKDAPSSGAPLLITGNAHKLKECQRIWPALRSYDLDLPEIQSGDPETVVRDKLLRAAQFKPGHTLLVEDTSLALSACQGLPGPFTKWFVKGMGVEALAQLAQTDPSAEAITWLGLFEHLPTGANLRLFVGRVRGTIVAPRGNHGFGWDPIFQPEGSTRTFAEMEGSEKDRYSARRLALEALRAYLS